ncbi:MAG: DNA gyrase inhibitor YacG [Gammaproteobacteria bacterium]|nr:DNA gyrase inhibitor YacG [Gammaproteobacteria bacterium]
MSNIKKSKIILSCPTCSKQVALQSEQPWRPFCSERCKLIDLGEWASDSYSIGSGVENEFQVNSGDS